MQVCALEISALPGQRVVARRDDVAGVNAKRGRIGRPLHAGSFGSSIRSPPVSRGRVGRASTDPAHPSLSS